MREEHGYQQIAERLSEAGLRPTRQRVMLGKLLFSGEDKHVTAESLHREAQRANIPVSMATVYNTLHQFTQAGLMRQIILGSNACYFDTNMEAHYHFYCRSNGMLVDVPASTIALGCLPPPPSGTTVESVDVIIRIQ